MVRIIPHFFVGHSRPSIAYFSTYTQRYLNQVPHNRYVRQWFYDKASKAVLDGVILCSKGKIPHTMKIVSMFPETNPSMDSYRIGTILELVRDAAITLAEQVRIL